MLSPQAKHLVPDQREPSPPGTLRVPGDKPIELPDYFVHFHQARFLKQARSSMIEPYFFYGAGANVSPGYVAATA